MATTSSIGLVNSAADTSALESLLSGLNNGSSGIDVTSTVAEIIAADEEPATQWQAQQTTLSNQTAALQQLEAQSSALSDDLSALQDPTGVLSQVDASSSDTGVVSASAAAGTAIGTHTVLVSQLATAGAWYSNEAQSSTAALPAGSFDLTEGGQTTTITIGGSSGVETLDELAASINQQSLGVNAAVVSDSNGARLSLVAQSTGTAADFTVSAASSLSFTQASAGQDASLTVDGVPITSASNTVTGAVNGLTLNLQGLSSGPAATISLAPSTSDILTALSSFVNDYNTLISDANAQFAYNSATQTDGTLSSDSAVRSFQSDLLGATNFSLSGGGSLSSLASLGIATNQDGTLSLDPSTLSNAITNNFSGVLSFFQGTATTTGFAASLTNTLNNYTDPTQGAFTVDLSSISSENQDLTNEIDTFQTYISQQQTTLTAEYNAANIALQQLPSQIKQTQVLLGEDNTSNS